MLFNSPKLTAIPYPHSLERFGKSLVAQSTRELFRPSHLESSKSNPCTLEKHLLRHQKIKTSQHCCYKNNLILALPGPIFSLPSPPSMVVHGLEQDEDKLLHKIVWGFWAQMVYLALTHKQMNHHIKKVTP